eukprot:3299790-Prymnesium_polylepis.1
MPADSAPPPGHARDTHIHERSFQLLSRTPKHYFIPPAHAAGRWGTAEASAGACRAQARRFLYHVSIFVRYTASKFDTVLARA